MKVTEVDMAGQVRSVIAELRQGTGTRQITFEVDALPNARADAVMIRRVWANLLDNAIKFTSLRPQASITVSATRAADAIIYSVADNGIGFDMSYVGKLFIMGNRLVGAEIIGSGIGLALVKRVVTRHGGRVWAEGKPDQGATFYFTLPASGEGHDQ
jgi:light-regulated signal transduction histidine kinase (bacteriophytochrome)